MGTLSIHNKQKDELESGMEPEPKVWGGKVWALKYIIIIIIIIIIINCIILVIKRENLG